MRSFFLQVHVKLRPVRMEGLAYVKSVQRTGENVSLSSTCKKTQRCYNQSEQGFYSLWNGFGRLSSELDNRRLVKRLAVGKIR